jgi:hypothetical protein
MFAHKAEMKRTGPRKGTGFLLGGGLIRSVLPNARFRVPHKLLGRVQVRRPISAGGLRPPAIHTVFIHPTDAEGNALRIGKLDALSASDEFPFLHGLFLSTMNR